MKKIFLLITIISISFISEAQNISYGVIIGTNSYDVETMGGNLTDPTENQFYINLGVFGDYYFNRSLGLKADLFYTFNKEGYKIKSTQIRFLNKVGYILLSPKLKYNVSVDYQKGFYVLLGPRASFLVSAKDYENNDINDFYKGSHYGLEFGLGTTFLKHFSIELIGDYGISDTSENLTETRNYGGFINLNINLESLINK